ncbi:hypothetical protein EDC01DRAFT_635874 [Geopyxis carbonaria]|nr:hypothetical protein EDC01DRAFT_635874 [Geopyxis carbonaria]
MAPQKKRIEPKPRKRRSGQIVHCGNCGLHFASKQALNVHTESGHTYIPEWVCTICQMYYATRNSLMNHETFCAEQLLAQDADNGTRRKIQDARSWQRAAGRLKDGEGWYDYKTGLRFFSKEDSSKYYSEGNHEYVYICERCSLVCATGQLIIIHLRTCGVDMELPLKLAQVKVINQDLKPMRKYRMTIEKAIELQKEISDDVAIPQYQDMNSGLRFYSMRSLTNFLKVSEFTEFVYMCPGCKLVTLSTMAVNQHKKSCGAALRYDREAENSILQPDDTEMVDPKIEESFSSHDLSDEEFDDNSIRQEHYLCVTTSPPTAKEESYGPRNIWQEIVKHEEDEIRKFGGDPSTVLGEDSYTGPQAGMWQGTCKTPKIKLEDTRDVWQKIADYDDTETRRFGGDTSKVQESEYETTVTNNAGSSVDKELETKELNSTQSIDILQKIALYEDDEIRKFGGDPSKVGSNGDDNHSKHHYIGTPRTSVQAQTPTIIKSETRDLWEEIVQYDQQEVRRFESPTSSVQLHASLDKESDTDKSREFSQSPKIKLPSQTEGDDIDGFHEEEIPMFCGTSISNFTLSKSTNHEIPIKDEPEGSDFWEKMVAYEEQDVERFT